MVQHDELDSIVRVSAVFNEDLTYDTVSMSKVDLAACEIVITVCGRNSWTSSGQPIVSVKVPLSSAAHNVPSRSLAPQYHVTDQPSRGSTPEILTQDSDRPQGKAQVHHPTMGEIKEKRKRVFLTFKRVPPFISKVTINYGNITHVFY